MSLGEPGRREGEPLRSWVPGGNCLWPEDWVLGGEEERGFSTLCCLLSLGASRGDRVTAKFRGLSAGVKLLRLDCP